jgi:ATP-binding cassette, subfamily F, member 3
MASRKKNIKERFGVETNAIGHRFKLNRDRAGYHTSLLEDFEADHYDPLVKWKIPELAQLRTRAPILKVDNVSFRYPSSDDFTRRNINLTIDQVIDLPLLAPTGRGKRL